MADRDLSEIPAARLQAELARRQRRVRTLMRRHDRLVKSAKAPIAEIAALGGSTGGISPGTAAAAAGGGAAMTATSCRRSEAALKAGYRTTSPSFRQIVNITQIRSGEFERVGRGRYRVK